ncbi:triple tyrosine motif-containing protein [Cesiribacter andamanensis]|nr:triple tyrosine motif-containing protein [Cesiribacter andamanensis]
MRSFLLSLLMLLLGIGSSPAQPLPEAIPLQGVPALTHYTRQDFNADPQFWAVTEDSAGVMYFGNNDGALVYDGERWHKVFLPNNSAVRSLTTDYRGQVWAGGYNELGQIRKDAHGRYGYHSLLDSLQLSGKNLENLWQIHALPGTVIYRSFHKLLAISGSRLTELPTTSTYLHSYLVHDQLLVQDKEQGILQLDLEKMKFSTLFSAKSLQHESVVALLPAREVHQLLAVAQSGRLYLLDRKNGSVTLWKKLFTEGANDQVISGLRSSRGLYYLGTLSSRILTLSETGQLLEEENHFERLQDKTVLNLYETSRGSLWVLLNRGLEYLDYSSPVSTLFDNASIYDVLINSNHMYLATNQGVFYTPLNTASSALERLRFQKVQGLEGQAWSLRMHQGEVLAGHDRGLFVVQQGSSRRIGELEGVWRVLPATGHHNRYLACTYKGLYVLEKEAASGWRVLGYLPGFAESIRDILPSDTPGTYWVCHGYKGVFKITLDEELSRVSAVAHFTDQNGLPSPFNINVFRWEDQIVFTTNEGIYAYDEAQNQFRPFAPLNAILDPSLNTRKLLQAGDKTWFVQDDEAGFFITREGKPSLQKELFIQFKGTFNRSMESILPLDSKRVLLGTNTGLHLFTIPHEQQPRQVSTLLSSVRYQSGQQEHSLPLAASTNGYAQLPHTTSSLRFEFAAPGMDNNARVQYSYKLEHVDEAWSPWQETPYKEYSHLRPGRYTLKARSRSLLGVSGSETLYQFEILPIWYNTPWAWALYAALAVLLVGLLVFLISRRLVAASNKTRREEQKARKLLELELAQLKLNAEKEHIRQEKELLEEDVIHKSKELANYTMLLVKKREVFAELILDLRALREAAKNESARSGLREIIKKVSHHLSDEEYLQVFDTNFEKIHHEFFTALKELYPDLNQRDLRLCAFVKMNLTNKEISPLLNISVRGVETARYRLRKKLNLEHEHNMVEFLEKLSPSATEEPQEVEET